MPENPDPLDEVDLSKEEPLDDFLEGAGVGLTEEEARDISENLSEDDGPPLPPPPHAPDDGYSPSKKEAERQDAEEEEDGEEAQEEEADDEEEALPNRGPQEGDWEFEYSDLKEPVQSDRLMFCVPLFDNKSPSVLEALQEIYLYLRALNLPVLRLHTDRSREFMNKATRRWFASQLVRVTTTEGDAPAKTLSRAHHQVA